jgi:hypothetical protein
LVNFFNAVKVGFYNTVAILRIPILVFQDRVRLTDICSNLFPEKRLSRPVSQTSITRQLVGIINKLTIKVIIAGRRRWTSLKRVVKKIEMDDADGQNYIHLY